MQSELPARKRYAFFISTFVYLDIHSNSCSSVD